MTALGAFREEINVGDRVTWLGLRGSSRHGTVTAIDLAQPVAQASIRTTKGNRTRVAVSKLVVIP